MGFYGITYRLYYTRQGATFRWVHVIRKDRRTETSRNDIEEP